MKLFAYNKPAGEEVAVKESDGITLYPASTLDKDAQGLVIYTDDAACADAVSAKAAEALMEFHVDTDTKLDYRIIQNIRAGLPGISDPCYISWTEANAFVIRLKACKKPLIDDIVASFGGKVTLIKKYAVGNLKIKKVAKGAFEEYSEEETQSFLA